MIEPKVAYCNKRLRFYVANLFSAQHFPLKPRPPPPPAKKLEGALHCFGPPGTDNLSYITVTVLRTPVSTHTYVDLLTTVSYYFRQTVLFLISYHLIYVLFAYKLHFVNSVCIKRR